MPKCLGFKADGEPCGSPEHLVQNSGYCFAHTPGGREHLQSIAGLGGAATKAKYSTDAFNADQLAPMVTLEDAKLALDEIRVAVLTRRITHTEGSSASKAVAEWVKAEASAQTQRLVNELRTALEAKGSEIEQLRKQLAGQTRGLRQVR